MKTTPQHAPGPWRMNDADNSIVAVQKPDDLGDIICEKPTYGLASQKRWQANAARIILAHNNHEALVEAINDLIGAMSIYSNPKYGTDVAKHIIKAKQALVAASSTDKPLDGTNGDSYAMPERKSK